LDAEHEAPVEGEHDAPAGEASKGISRKKFVVGGAAAGATIGLAGGANLALAKPKSKQAAARANPEDEELIFFNGKIHTMDAQNRVVSAVTVRNGRFAEVGDDVVRRGKNLINLKGRTVVPGIIDNHNHIILMGNRPGYHTPLENARTIADVQATIAARAAGVPAGAWITTIGGWNTAQLAELRFPTLAELDAAAPNHPVYVHVGFNGSAATNSKGRDILAANGVTVAADGLVTSGGQQATRALLYLRQTLLNPAERRRSTLDAIAYGLGLGVTTHIDQGAFQKTNTPADGAAHEDNYTMQLPFLELHREGLLRARVQINFLHMETDPALPELKARLRNAFQFFGDDMLNTGGIGEFIASGTTTNFMEASRVVAQARWRAEVHSLGTVGAQGQPADFMNEISAWEAANAEFPIGDLRWVIAHVPRITLEWVNRLKALGGGLSLTGWQWLAGNLPTNQPPYAGPPFRLIVDSGIPTGMSSDGMQIAPMNPWIHMYYATTGLNSRGVQINPGQQITRQEVLRLYTANNGWFLRMEDKVGSIETGKLGDLVVLNKDYFSVPDAELHKIRASLTVVDGKIVHDDGSIKH
jgi:predicted amidohydrolase YtcJ